MNNKRYGKAVSEDLYGLLVSLRRELKKEFGSDFSFAILGQGEVLAQNNASGVVEPALDPLRNLKTKPNIMDRFYATTIDLEKETEDLKHEKNQEALLLFSETLISLKMIKENIERLRELGHGIGAEYENEIDALGERLRKKEEEVKI